MFSLIRHQRLGLTERRELVQTNQIFYIGRQFVQTNEICYSYQMRTDKRMIIDTNIKLLGEKPYTLFHSSSVRFHLLIIKCR